VTIILQENKHLFLNGQWIVGEGTKRELINPATEGVITSVYEASKRQTQQAIQFAYEAFHQTDWATNSKKRSNHLLTLAQLLEESTEEFAILETVNTGKPIREAMLDISDSAICLRYYADLLMQQEPWIKEMEDSSTSKVVKEPIGVCSLIVPWNFPLLLGIWKIAPALAAGNTIVFKPSERTPLTAMKFAQLIEKAKLPAGVFNLVLGSGNPVGETMVMSELVDKVSFTGGSGTGRRINEQCAKTFKRVSLELGGKSPLLVFEDADLHLATEWALFGAFFNQGEVCVASSRLLVHVGIYEAFIDQLLVKLETLKIGNPLNENTELGPVINKQHLEKVLDYVQLAKEEGAVCVYGGERVNSTGYYMTPAVFTNVKQDMKIVQEEVFGPFVTIQTFQTDQEAINLANGTKFGLAAGILTNDIDRAEKIASVIKAGTIWINGYHTPYVEAPWGGYKHSGIGRELGPQGLDTFRETKHVNLKGQLEPLNWYSL
jgi:betaine-aldehyde dehydrogenase